MTHCPTCGQAIVKRSRRVCADCGKQITRHHKFYFGDDGRVRHRICDHPDSYSVKPEEPQAQSTLIEAGAAA